MKNFKSLRTITLSTFLLMTPCVMAEDTIPASYWNFDEDQKLELTGYAEYVKGVRGTALKFDGFTARVTSKADTAIDVTTGFTVETWIAPQEYSWNWTGLVDQEKGHREGFSLGINYIGQVGLSLALNDSWHVLLSQEAIPLLTWSHVAATFDPTNGIAVFINGQSAGKKAMLGKVPPPRPTFGSACRTPNSGPP